MQVICTVPVMFSYFVSHSSSLTLNVTVSLAYAASRCLKAKPEDGAKVAAFLNDDVAHTCRKYPKQFVGLGTLPMQVRVHYAAHRRP